MRNGLCFVYLLFPFALFVAGVFHWRQQTRFPDTSFWPRKAPVVAATTSPERAPAAAEPASLSVDAAKKKHAGDHGRDKDHGPALKTRD